MWNVPLGPLLNDPFRHQHWLWSARFSPDGKRIVTASDDHTARVWDAESGLPLSEPLEHEGQEWTAEFSPDGKRVLTASVDGTARIWDLVPSRSKCPTWLLQLAEAVSGQVPDSGGALEALTLDRAEMVKQVQERLNHEPAGDDWAIWGRWFLAEPTTRTISPFSKITFREYLAHRLAENTGEGLEEVRRWTDLDRAESICRESLSESRKVWPDEPARWQASLSSLVAVLGRERKFEQAARVFNDVLKPPGPPNLLINDSFEFGSFATTTVTPGACNINRMILAPWIMWS